MLCNQTVSWSPREGRRLEWTAMVLHWLNKGGVSLVNRTTGSQHIQHLHGGVEWRGSTLHHS
jgi:hypothetical protein